MVPHILKCIINPSQSLVLLSDELKARMLKFVEERTEVNTVTTFSKFE